MGTGATMDCETCNHLLAAYRLGVGLLKDAVQNGLGATGDDASLTSKEATRLSQLCKDASDALMEHWHKDHTNLSHKAVSAAALVEFQNPRIISAPASSPTPHPRA